MTRLDRAAGLIKAFERTYPEAHCELDYSNPLELLIATILSAQCTDKRVNMVTPALFQRCRSARAYAEIDSTELERMIQSAGFFRAKAKSIKAACADLVAKHGGQVPRTMEALTSLRGVGRKTANVVLGNAFDINEGVVVDTHVQRLSYRLGLTRHTDPVKIEQDLMKLVPQPEVDDLLPLAHLARTPPLHCPIARLPRLRSPRSLPERREIHEGESESGRGAEESRGAGLFVAAWFGLR